MFNDLKPHELTAIIFGFTGFILSLVTFVRVIMVDRKKAKKDKVTAIKQKRLEVLTLCIEAITVTSSSRRQFLQISHEALSNKLFVLMKDSADLARSASDQLARLETIRSMLALDLPTGKELEKLNETLDKSMIELKQHASPKLIREQERDFVSTAREQITLAPELRRAEMALEAKNSN